MSWKGEIIDWTKSIIIAVAIGVFIIVFIGQPTRVYMSSMETTLHQGDMVYLEKVSQKLDKLKRGQIIAFRSPIEDKLYIKRVIAVEGDHIRISNGKVYLNDEELSEPYVNGAPTYRDLDLVVPEDSLFVMGDNRMNSTDSRSFGCISKKSVFGRALFRYYPFQAFKVL